MPKKQTTAAKRARAAANSGAKYTKALRQTPPHGGIDLPPYVEFVDEETLSEGERAVVDHLRALAAAGRPLPVRYAAPDPAVVETRARAQATGGASRWPHRWASVEAAVDGYILREVQYGPNRSGYTKTNRGPRVPVPVRAADGTVRVVAMPEWARLDGIQWVWVHTGWPVEHPGRIVDPPQDFNPAPSLRWQVAVWLDLSREDGRVLGEDYGGGASGWETVGWCSTRDDALLIARAFTAYRGNHTRADVIEHGSDLGVVSTVRETYLQADDAPERPRPVLPAGPRPASPDRSEIPEPSWNPSEPHPPTSSLNVWTGTGWRPLVWTEWRSNQVAAVLRIGEGGPYAWAEAWGPRHPDSDLHDWTQEGRELVGQHPEPTSEQSTARFDAARQARETALVAALAERGRLTAEQTAARLEAGGEEYRTVLEVGQATISRALHTARRALPEGPERTAIRYALDDLADLHLLPADAERIAGEQLDHEIDKQRDPAVTAWCRRAVTEYVAPAPDPAAAGVDGFRTQDT